MQRLSNEFLYWSSGRTVGPERGGRFMVDMRILGVWSPALTPNLAESVCGAGGAGSSIEQFELSQYTRR